MAIQTDGQNGSASLYIIFFDADLPKCPLDEHFLICLKPYARLVFPGRINYFALHPDRLAAMRPQFCSGPETHRVRLLFENVQRSVPQRMRDPELYMYVGMLSEALYPGKPCVFFTGDRKQGRKRTSAPAIAPRVSARYGLSDSGRIGFPPVWRVAQQGADIIFQRQNSEHLRGFPYIMREEFEQDGYEGLVIKRIPIVQLGQHSSKDSHKRIAEQIIAWFFNETGVSVSIAR